MKRHLRVAGFSLVEVTLAIGIAAFCLMAVFGVMPIGLQTSRNAASQTAATNIMAAVVADLRATPKPNATSTQSAARRSVVESFPAAVQRGPIAFVCLCARLCQRGLDAFIA